MEAVNPIQRGSRSVQEVSSTVRRLCAHSADQQQQSDLFLSLALQLRTLTLQQLNDVWQEVSFKCLDDWQPLLEALPACGSEECIQFTTNLILNKEIGQDHIISFLSTVTFASHPTPSMISHISSLLTFPPIRPKTILAVSSLVHRLCRRERTPCSQIPEVQQLVRVLKEDLGESCGWQEPLPITELLHVLKAVENIGLPEFIPQLKICIHNHSAPVELRLAAVQAFRHIPCHRKVCISIDLVLNRPSFFCFCLATFFQFGHFANSQPQTTNQGVERLGLVSSTYEATTTFFELLLMLRHIAAKHTRRKMLSALFYVHWSASH
ncbi:uncharacterized protein LOC128610681 [Ictalurus furcatus]|uniref:uncharacterized protein LOC128610681 n=1 Tax=Ictalurus furcatus TaxID=66913 RepID=UPI0023506EBC|nr:uncharacterized protein LOC128610681 [Ictalurus furcatus]